MQMTARRKRIIWFLSIVALIFGGIIMAMSLLGAGRELTLSGNRLTELRKIPVGSYRFPETGILPGNVLYPIKEWRDWWWLRTTKGEKGVELAIFLADKKWQEAIELDKLGITGLSIKSGRLGLNRLQYANQLKNGVEDRWRRGELGKMIDEAVRAYRASKMGQIRELEQLLDRWDETQKEENQ